MMIYIYKNKQQTGPFNADQIRRQLASGVLVPHDLAWSEGMAGWKPLSSFHGLIHQDPSPQPLIRRTPLQENGRGSIADSVRTIPRLIAHPVREVNRILGSHDERFAVATGVIVCIVASLALVVLAYFRVTSLMGPFASEVIKEKVVSIAFKSLLVLITPAAGLTVANLIQQKILPSANPRANGIGAAVLGAATACLPLQAAAACALVIGLGNSEIIAVVIGYAVILATLITYDLPHSAQDKQSSSLLLLTPVKIAFAAYVTKLLLVEMLDKFLV